MKPLSKSFTKKRGKTFKFENSENLFVKGHIYIHAYIYVRIYVCTAVFINANSGVSQKYGFIIQ